MDREKRWVFDLEYAATTRPCGCITRRSHGSLSGAFRGRRDARVLRPSGRRPEGRDVNLLDSRLGLLEAHREFDRKHESGAKFVTFAFPRVQRKVQQAVEVLGGVPRGELSMKPFRTGLPGAMKSVKTPR